MREGKDRGGKWLIEHYGDAVLHLAGIRAYVDGETDYFLIPDTDAGTIGGKFCVQLTWYGHSRSLFTRDFIDELLTRAGFEKTMACDYQETASSFPEITTRDNRKGESLFVEAFK